MADPHVDIRFGGGLAGFDQAIALDRRLDEAIDEAKRLLDLRPPHEISWTLNGSGQLRGRLVCSADPQDRCHWSPTCECEYINDLGIDEDGPYHLAIEDPVDHGYPDDLGYEEVQVKHRMTYGDVCAIAEHVNADPEILAENIAGDVGSIVGIGRTLVDLTWNGDYYEWKPVTP